MGKNISRREFVKAGAVAIAAGVLGPWGRALVHQAAQSLKVKAAAAGDPDPEPELSQEEVKGLLAAQLERKNKLRRDLRWAGWYPIVQGNELYPEEEPGRGEDEAEIASRLAGLSDEDLFAVNVIVGCLACA